MMVATAVVDVVVASKVVRLVIEEAVAVAAAGEPSVVVLHFPARLVGYSADL